MQKNFLLNVFEEEQFKNLINTRPKDQKVQELCLKYYCEFRGHQPSIQSDKIILHLKCAYYLAEKSQWITDLNGKRIRNAGLSLNELLKKHTLEDVMIALKSFSKTITIDDPQTSDDLQKLIKEISFLITFYSKFQKVLLKLQLKDKNPQYSQTLAEMVWLLYIEAKNKILLRSLELIENTCMLAHALVFVLVYSWDYHQPGYFTKNENNLQKLTSRKQINTKIHQKILQFFIIKNVEYYKNIADKFQTYFNYMKTKHIIRMDENKNNFLSPQFIQANYKRLDYFYEKKIDYNYLDERIFFRDRISNAFTPFARQKINFPMKRLGGNINGLTDRTVQQQGNYHSHRILNYDKMETQIQQTSLIDVPPADIKFPKNMIQTPLNTLTPLIQQTPYTTGMMLYNYVNEMSLRCKNKKYSLRQVDQVIFQTIDAVLKDAVKGDNEKTKELRRFQIFSVYRLAVEDFIQLYPSQVQTEDIMKSILLIATEIVLFASNIDVSFDKLQEIFNVSYISLWRAVDFFLKFDKSMPINLKIHLLDVEVDIISEKIWRDAENIANIHNFLMNKKFSSKEIDQIYEKLCKRILHQIAFQIIQLSKTIFQTKQLQQKISQIGFDIMKQVLLNHPYMILKNHIDQIIMCTTFSICRIFKLNVMFKYIRQMYLQCNAHLSDQKKMDIFRSMSYERENGEDQNPNNGIIGFYNSCFLVEMNNFVKSKCQNNNIDQGNISSRPSTQRALQQKDVNVLLKSPMNAIIPKNVNYGSKRTGPMTNGTAMHQNKSNTSRLHAYTQSPLLRNEMVPVKIPINSRKAINFDEQQNKHITKKDQQMNDTCKLYQQNAKTNSFVNKKFSTSTRPTNMIADTTLMLKPSNGTLSPTPNRQSPSPKVIHDPLVKQNNNSHNIHYTKRQFGDKNGLNLNR